MVHEDATSEPLEASGRTKTPSQPGARRADKSLRRHEDKLAKAERRSARKRRKRARAPEDATTVEQPTEQSHQIGRVPAQATETAVEGLSDLDVAAVVVQGGASLSGRVGRRDRRRAAAMAAARPEEDEPELVLVEGSTPEGVGSGRSSRAADRTERRIRRRVARRGDAARAVADAVPLVEPAGPGSGEGSGAAEPAVAESAAVPRGRPRRRTVGLVVVALLLVGAATLPWLVPGVPRFLADLVPGQDAKVATVKDPPVGPSREAFTGPVGVEQQGGPYAGVRLEAAGWPRQVVVPRLHVDSRVVPISGQSGSLLPPSDPQILGWWQEGRPVGSQHGSAVITGHTVHTGGGALDHLGELVVGDSVRVRTDAGWIRYVVQQTRIYSTAELARDAENVFRLGGTGRLVLITCDDWNGQSYDSNAVVVAAPVLDQPNGS
jgi:LPXTG-site transpeptidase (sortase) family protein